jgi:DNA-directed RNA polymerase specialized sigma24 family protein
MKKIDEGAEITSPTGFICSVANYIFQENNEPGRFTELDEQMPLASTDPSQLELEDGDPLIDCFDKCLEELPPDNKQLIMEYYQEEKRTKIDLRKQLAEQLNIPMNALRIRAHRIRKSLEECIQHCLAH